MTPIVSDQFVDEVFAEYGTVRDVSREETAVGRLSLRPE